MPKFSSEYLVDTFKHQVKSGHRTIFVVIGEGSKHQIPTLHSKLRAASELKSIIWCFKNVEASLDKECKKLRITEEDSEFERWIKTNDVEYIMYKEGSKILGRTCDMLVLQDFEALTCNMMACAIETVRGGGAVVLLFDMEKSIKEVIQSKSELVAQIAGEGHVPRFNRRLFRFLTQFPFAIFLDAKLRIMDITKERPGTPAAAGKPTEAVAVPPSARDEDNKLLGMCKTRGQLAVLASLIALLDANEPSISSIVAERGRGKSAVLGLAIVLAIERNFPLIIVSSLFLDNVQAIFDFVASGLDALGYRKARDYKITYVMQGKRRMISKIEILKGYRRTVEFAQAFDELKIYPSLLVIDEAAAIPLPSLKKLLDARLVFMASTASGYEGTGRVFRTKLVEYIKEKSSRSHTYEMTEPIRYAPGDEVEAWLNRTLLLETKVSEVYQRPLPTDCKLYYVCKDALFSANPQSEEFLNEIFSLFVASHYRNSPNDIQILSDSPNHEIFALMTPNSPLRVLCAVQVSFEGRCKKTSPLKEGNLIPWVVYDNFFDECFLEKLGVRIVRIAVHPNVLSMGYGSAALLALVKLFSDRHVTPTPEPDEVVSICPASGSQPYISYKDDTVLFHPIGKINIPKIEWMGASFGVSEKLLNFWKRAGFGPVCMKQMPSKTTGDFATVVMRNIRSGTEDEMRVLFLHRFVPLLSYSFCNLPPTLALSLIYSSTGGVKDKKICFSPDEITRLKMFVKGLINIMGITDILPDVARRYFYRSDVNRISLLSQTALLMLGCQRKSVDYVATYLGIDYFKVCGLIVPAVESLEEVSRPEAR